MVYTLTLYCEWRQSFNFQSGKHEYQRKKSVPTVHIEKERPCPAQGTKKNSAAKWLNMPPKAKTTTGVAAAGDSSQLSSPVHITESIGLMRDDITDIVTHLVSAAVTELKDHINIRFYRKLITTIKTTNSLNEIRMGSWKKKFQWPMTP